MCCKDSLIYQAEPFIDDEDKPYCRWCGEKIKDSD